MRIGEYAEAYGTTSLVHSVVKNKTSASKKGILALTSKFLLTSTGMHLGSYTFTWSTETVYTISSSYWTHNIGIDVGMNTYTHICPFYREAISPPLSSTWSICHDSHLPKDKTRGYHLRATHCIMSLLYSLHSPDTGNTLQKQGKPTCSFQEESFRMDVPIFMPYLSHTHDVWEVKLLYRRATKLHWAKF